jgi:hypothetical protein
MNEEALAHWGLLRQKKIPNMKLFQAVTNHNAKIVTYALIFVLSADLNEFIKLHLTLCK